MCIQRILQHNQDLLGRIAWLREHSPYFPQIYTKNLAGGEIAASTLEEIMKDVSDFYGDD